ncbi:MAG: hypothetical protein EOM44_00495 [Bacteroidia bacterium]|nr:hypothetical protein [Bacteroidia bacterium]
MVLSFNQNFPEKIINGTKIHTIHQDTTGRWKAGMKIQFATGARTEAYNQFHEAECTGVQDIEIRYTDMRGAVEIYIDGKHLGTWHRFMPPRSVNVADVLRLAVNDGFEGVTEFLNWFQRDFKGKVIHWTDVRY